jgi:acid stress-induced BolA-like protein IbaG/YrbA
MRPDDLKKLIESQLANSVVHVASNDNVHFQAEVVCPLFEGKSRIQQQQMVYAIVNDYIKSGEVHALSLKTSVFSKN